jgi:hypothetical protein
MPFFCSKQDKDDSQYSDCGSYSCSLKKCPNVLRGELLVLVMLLL